ncbi:MAG: rhomboid family intramembrane serine protease [Bacteroidota bacterium]
MQRLTPVVLNLVIINVLVFLLLMLLPYIGSSLQEINSSYFTLHKSNLLGFRNTFEADFQERYLYKSVELTDGTMLTEDNVEQLISNNPKLRSQVISYLSAPVDQFKPIQIVTWFFNHSPTDIFHIIFNMLVLASIGPIMESIFRSRRFLKFYLFCGLFGGVLVAFLDPSNNPVLGASGAISGLLLAFAMFFPDQKLLLFFVLPVKASTLMWVVGIGSAVLVGFQAMGVDLGGLGTISHFGHLSGMISAMVFFYLEKYVPFLQ